MGGWSFTSGVIVPLWRCADLDGLDKALQSLADARPGLRLPKGEVGRVRVGWWWGNDCGH